MRSRAVRISAQYIASQLFGARRAMRLRLHGAACASLAPNACVVHHLGASQLSFDSTIGAAKMAVRFRESLEAKVWPDRPEGGDELCAEVWPDDSATPPVGAALLTLGHQQDAHGAMPCPASASLPQSPSPRLAAVALVVDPERRCILLTRRPRAMRTFPGAWVLPGGSVDATDGSTAAAALRELAEETGLTPAVDAAANPNKPNPNPTNPKPNSNPNPYPYPNPYLNPNPNLTAQASCGADCFSVHGGCSNPARTLTLMSRLGFELGLA